MDLREELYQEHWHRCQSYKCSNCKEPKELAIWLRLIFLAWLPSICSICKVSKERQSYYSFDARLQLFIFIYFLPHKITFHPIPLLTCAGNSNFLPGKMPPSLSTLTKLKVLSLRDTNRAGDMGDFDMTNLKKTLVSFNIAENPGFAAG